MSKEIVAKKKSLAFARAVSPESMFLMPVNKNAPEGVRTQEIVIPAHVSTPSKGKNAGKTINVPERVSGVRQIFVSELPEEAAIRIKALPEAEQSEARKNFETKLASEASKANKMAIPTLNFIAKSGLFAILDNKVGKGGGNLRYKALKQNAQTTADLVNMNAKLMAELEEVKKQLAAVSDSKNQEDI